MTTTGAFVFKTERRLVTLTGLRASDLQALIKGLREVTGASIFYHTHHQYLSHHFQRPLFQSDFAIWVDRALQEVRLAEKLTAIDLLGFSSIRQLREAILTTIEIYLAEAAWPARQCLPGDEFHFCKSKSFIMSTGVVAHDVPDLFRKLSGVSTTSLYFHFFEARLRLERPTNDFSQWLCEHREDKLASAIDKLNPYMLTLDELRERIIDLGWRFL